MKHWTVKVKFPINAHDATHLKRALEHSIDYVRNLDVSDREHGMAEKAAWAADLVELRERLETLIKENWE